jgi:hypothetical protein
MPCVKQLELAAGAAHAPLVHVWQASQSAAVVQGPPTHSVVAVAHVSPGLQSDAFAQYRAADCVALSFAPVG